MEPLPPRGEAPTQRYATCIAASRRVRWDIEKDVIRGRTLDFGQKFMPDSLSRVGELAFLGPADRLFLSQVQGRTYANMFRLVERYIGAKVLQVAHEQWFADPVAAEALLRFTDEELKHQQLFARLEAMAAAGMPPGYSFRANPEETAALVLGKSTWAVLGLTLDIELLTLGHYRSGIEPDTRLSPLWKDVFLFHWKEECQHAILDELEWRREDARLDAARRDAAVDELIDLVRSLDMLLVVQAAADAEYFLVASGRSYSAAERGTVHALVLRAYRWQYIASGVNEPRFLEVLRSLVTPAQMERVTRAVAPIVASARG